MKIEVVGIDPSLRNFGFAHGVLDLDTMEIEVNKLVLAETAGADKKTAKVVRKNSDDLDRAQILHKAIQEQCKGKRLAFVEVPVGSQSARAMASYGICVGVLASCPIPMIQLTPTEVKLAMTGDKNATKDDMIAAAHAAHPNANWLTRKLKGEIQLVDKNEHLADATAAIYAGVLSDQFQQVTAILKSA